MPGGPLGGCRGWMEGLDRGCERGLVSIISLKIVSTVWFLVREVEPYYGKYKGIMNQFSLS